jgi:hypothetical protein
VVAAAAPLVSPMLAAARSALLGGATRHAPPLGLGCMQQHVRGRRAKYVPAPSSTELALLIDAAPDGRRGGRYAKQEPGGGRHRRAITTFTRRLVRPSPPTLSPHSAPFGRVSRDLAAVTHRVQVREELLAEATRLGLGPTRVTSAEPSSRCEPSGSDTLP